MAEKPKVAVLLATHHPEDYIKDQIASIKNQVAVEVIFYWGDYKSTEAEKQFVRDLLTESTFHEYQVEDPGPAANFFYLLSKTCEEFIAFSDQDDIWLPNKLARQVTILEKFIGVPALSHTNSDLLKGSKRISRNQICQNHTFYSLAFTNCCQGCTIMINKKAKEEILSSLPANILWHDWWMALVISLVGSITYINEVMVLYRIHEKNTIGVPNLLQRILNNLRRSEGLISYQIGQAILGYEDQHQFETAELETIKLITSENRWDRFRALVFDKQRRAKKTDDYLRKIAGILRQP